MIAKPKNTKLMLPLIGRYVEVQSVLNRKNKSSGIAGECLKVYEQTKMSEPRIGIIVGFATLTGGIVVHKYGTDVPPTYIVKNRYPALRVVFWPTRAPVYVSLDMAILAVAGKPVSDSMYWDIVHRSHAPQSYSETVAKVMQDEMKDWPRDSKGRWAKKAIITKKEMQVEEKTK